MKVGFYVDRNIHRLWGEEWIVGIISIGYFSKCLDVERDLWAMKVVFCMNENFYRRWKWCFAPIRCIMVGSVETTGVGALVGCTTADRDTKKPRRGGATRQKICGRPDGSPAYPEEKNSRLMFQPPKLSNMRFSGGTPRLSSMPSTAFDMGPGPHM